MRKRIYALCLRHLYPLRRDFDLLSDMIYWPIIDVLLWGITSQWLSNSKEVSAISSAILIGLIFWNIIWRSQSEVSRNLIEEIWNNNLVNLFSTPITLIEWILGALVLSLIKMSLTITVIIPFIFLMYSINVFTLGWYLIPFFICLVMTGWWVGFISAGVVLRHGPKVQTVVWTLPGILLPFSAVFFPLALLPAALQPIARLLPTTYIFEAMRSLVSTASFDWSGVFISMTLNILYLGLALLWFTKSFHKSLQLGLGRFN